MSKEAAGTNAIGHKVEPTSMYQRAIVHIAGRSSAENCTNAKLHANYVEFVDDYGCRWAFPWNKVLEVSEVR